MLELEHPAAEPKAASSHEAQLLEVVYYTDPLCCWSWAFEPQWRKLRYEFSEKLTWRYRMGGMIADWKTYDDPLNSIRRPAQMGPLWKQAENFSGMPMNDRIWLNDPPASSYPACIAFKSAELQSTTVAEKYLRKMRKAIMINGLNIAKKEILLSLAKELAEETTFDPVLFEKHFNGDEGLEAFREDLQKCRYYNIGRYPTLTINNPGKGGVLITGYRPYEVLLKALQNLDPDLQPSRKAHDHKAYQQHWKELTPRELQEGISETK